MSSLSVVDFGSTSRFRYCLDVRPALHPQRLRCEPLLQRSVNSASRPFPLSAYPCGSASHCSNRRASTHFEKSLRKNTGHHLISPKSRQRSLSFAVRNL